MSFDVKLQYNNSPNNKLNKGIHDIEIFSGTLKNETSIIDPVILLECSMGDVRNANYMTIPQFGRSYFIKNITSIRNNLVAIAGHVDVLTTYADDIRNAKGIIKRAEKKGHYNLLLDDGSLRTYQDPILRYKKFPTSFKNAYPQMECVLAVAGPVN